jgi:glycosyltransferase involved in cell wall biosynthesis
VTSRPRVLFVDHETRLSGGQRDLVDLVRALGPARVEAHVALPGEGRLAEALRGAGATVHLLPMALELRRVSRWRLQREPWGALGAVGAASRAAGRLHLLLRRVAPDIVHTNSLKAHLLALPAARLAGTPLVWHVRDVLPDGWLASAFAAASHGASRVLCISRAVAEPLVGRSAPAAPRVRVVYNGVAPAAVPPGAAGAFRAELGVPENVPLVGIVGQLARWKGQDVFVEAARLLGRRRPDAAFVVVGECLFPENEAAFVRELEERAARSGLDGRLRFAGPREPIEPVMAALDVLVHASRLAEPFGRVIVEGLAQGTPVVTTAAGAGAELVPPEAGRVVPPDDPVAVAGAVEELLAALHDEPGCRPSVAEAARRAAARFTPEATAASVLEVYEELLR